MVLQLSPGKFLGKPPDGNFRRFCAYYMKLKR